MGFRKLRKQEHKLYPPEQDWKPRRWGDTAVGKWNNGVNGEEGLAGGGAEHGWDVVELGAGALRKTAHLLTALAEAVGDTEEPAITYHALDLSKPELDRVLGQMDEQFGDALQGKVTCIGLHGDYNAGIQVVREGALPALSSAGVSSPEQSPSTPEQTEDNNSSPPASPLSARLVTPAMEYEPLPLQLSEHDDDLASSLNEAKWHHESTKVTEMTQTTEVRQDRSAPSPTPSERPLHFMFLGSSLGNFDRDEAAPFLRGLPLKPGDTLLLGLDGRPPPGQEGRTKLERAYNDPSGHTRAFEEHGWDVAMAELGVDEKGDRGVEFVGRYNEPLGRHEAYFRAKRDLTLPLSTGETKLKKGELLHIEWSYKYSEAEAYAMFDEADLRVKQFWKAPDSDYHLWLLERPAVRFPSMKQVAASRPESWHPSLPTWDEWNSLWALWDHITLDMIPQEMLHQKPIDLRHICLFYLGHIPTFLDIYLTRMSNGQHTHPVKFKDIFERGIDPDVDDPTQIHPHSEVPDCEEAWPSLEEIVKFRDDVRARLRGIYDKIESGKAPSALEIRSIFMAYEHEAMHAETLLYMLLQSPLTRPPTEMPNWQPAKATPNTIITVPATTVTLGHDDLEKETSQELGWDNEHPAHKVSVPSFKVNATPITNGEYFAWVRSIGALPRLDANSAPASWVQHDGQWAVKSLYGPVPMSIASSWPLMASRDEICAYAASKGGRLPTEAELRALWAHADIKPVRGFDHWHPVAPKPAEVDHGTKVSGHNGGVWEWTSTKFDGYEGYVPSELYPGYSSDFFDGKHYVVPGGSFATIPRMSERASFRNWYQGNYRYAWVGGRVVYD